MRFLVLLLVVLFSQLQAQRTDYTIDYSVCCASDSTVEVAKTILRQVQAELKQSNINVRIQRIEVNSTPDANSLAQVDFYELFDGERIIIGVDAHIKPLQSPITVISPFLEDGLTIPVSLSQPTSIDLFSAVTAYATGDCTLLAHFERESSPPYLDFYRANCALLQSDLQQAANLYPTALHDAGGDYWFPTVTNLAWTYLQMGKSDQAFKLLQDVIDTKELFGEIAGEITAYTIRSQLYALAFRYDEAIADMDVAIALDPDDPALYVERGQRILLLYQWDRVLADYNHALELDPTYADAYYYRGILYSSVPEGIDARRDALADFQHYLELAPNGDHAADAARYAAEIQAQVDALTAASAATTSP